MQTLLTKVIIQAVMAKENADGFGVSIINLPELDYSLLVQGIKQRKRLEIYFLGFQREQLAHLQSSLPQINDVCYFFTVEEAEDSRNSGAEDVFRVHIVKNQELEKVSSLRWYDTIGMDQVYKRSCEYVRKTLSPSNDTIANLLKALGRQDIRSILNFERVLCYLEALLNTPSEQLPQAISDNLYMLGLLAHKGFGIGAPTIDDFRSKIKRNHELTRKISSLEQKERQNITSYASVNPDNELTRLILNYYRTRDIELLRQMDVDEVEKCLKSAATSTGSNPKKNSKASTVNATTAAAQLVFDNDLDQIDEVIDKVQQAVDERSDTDKADKVEISVGSAKMKIYVEPTTEAIAQTVSTEEYWGGRIYAEVKNPKDVLDALKKYELDPFDASYTNKRIREYLSRAKRYITDSEAAEEIFSSFEAFALCREKILPYSKRLQDIPMLQVINKYKDFAEYLSSYERLLISIKNHFAVLWSVDSVGAKDIVNTIISLDFLYVLGTDSSHVIPTPLHPLYLWKYIKLAQEMLESGRLEDGQDCYLSEDDKTFIIRKAEDIPDPLTLVLVPNSIAESSECLPIAGRIGCLPVYSTKPQINEGETGMEAVQQGIIRYMCLYPHSSMMLRITLINPPTVEAVVDMLKRLDKDKEFAAFGSVGIDLSIYRTKEASSDWMEIQDKSLNEGMLGKIKGKKSGRFNLSIVNQKLSYTEIICRLNREQHLLVVFDPNEKQIDLARNSRHIHIHPLCVPKVYEYNRIQGSVRIRPANEGGIFADYAGILEKLREQPSSFGHRSVFMNSPLQEDTYKQLLGLADWLMILDQNLKSWDISLRSASEKLFYKGYDYRSIGIYSKNSGKFVLGYNQLIASLGNYIPNDDGVKNVIRAIRDINDDGLLSIASHSTNSIFDQNHGKGSLGLALAAIHYKQRHPASLLVGLDTQLAREWLSDREDGKLPDLIGLRFSSQDTAPQIDIIEVKTHADYTITQGTISGHAVEQTLILEGLLSEMFGYSEKITTVSRKEILREQVFECLFHSELSSDEKYEHTQWLNGLFAGKYAFGLTKTICHVDFESATTSEEIYPGEGDASHESFRLLRLGSSDIQALLTNTETTHLESTPDPVPSNMQETPVEQATPATQEQSAEQPGAHAAVEEHSQNADDTASTAKAQADEGQTLSASVNEPVISPEIKEKCIRLNIILKGYGIKANPVDESLVQQAARFTRFKIELKPGETIKKLMDKSQDIARELEAFGEIFIDNIKGTRYVGMDVPLADIGKPLILLENLHRLNNGAGSLNVLAGQTPDGSYQLIDLARAPHMLIAGTTGSGKTVFLYSIIVSLLQKLGPEDLELLIVDPKQTDFHFFEGIPHLRGQRVLTDANEALDALELINSKEKEIRTQLIRSVNSRDIDSYNGKNPDKRMKRLVVIIDEYADLVQAAELQGKDVRRSFETNLCMLAQRVRNLGIHLVIATQQPRATIVTSSLKAVLPYRASFRLPSHVDSQTILDRAGAEDLLGKGDMLLMTDSDIIRMQGFYISEEQLLSFIESKK
ncbi:FtsK/SpoIIIE domain-containing protein [Desulfotomaculum sp. 1211_IL3151]|uniref:FtsK/SpoIIIE domain-containing protein n=1 Tax=Desulfotomaculum sp. 1211_IL3151 TaxID=3084055 RepID=UPI002FD9D0E4